MRSASPQEGLNQLPQPHIVSLPRAGDPAAPQGDAQRLDDAEGDPLAKHVVGRIEALGRHDAQRQLAGVQLAFGL